MTDTEWENPLAYCADCYDGWACTREDRHPGDHVARTTDGEICAEWSQDKSYFWNKLGRRARNN